MTRTAMGLAALLALGCGGGGGDDDAGPVVDVDAGPGGGADAGPGGGTDAGPGGGSDAGIVVTGDPFTGPEGEWSFEPIEGAVCGNGSTMPVLVNRAPSATDDGTVLFFLQGGGACWDANTCFTFRAASHISDTLDEATLRGEAPDFSRAGTDAWSRATWIYVPYCTGDLHTGRNVATYSTFSGDREVHHMGAANMDLILERAHATVPAATKVWITGVSAGGYGATFNFWRTRERWPGVRVDVVNDSGAMVQAPAATWSAIRTNWVPDFPPGCTECDGDLSAVLPHYEATISDPHRFAFLSYDADRVIRTFFQLGADEFRTQVTAQIDAMDETDTQRAFLARGDGHVLSGSPGVTSGGVSVGEWLVAFQDDDATWETVRPE